MNDEPNFEETLTWAEVNRLRFVITDHRRGLQGALLLAEADGIPSAGKRAAYEDAVRLESKVMALFNRASGARTPASSRMEKT